MKVEGSPSLSIVSFLCYFFGCRFSLVDAVGLFASTVSREGRATPAYAGQMLSGNPSFCPPAVESLKRSVFRMSLSMVANCPNDRSNYSKRFSSYLNQTFLFHCKSTGSRVGTKNR